MSRHKRNFALIALALALPLIVGCGKEKDQPVPSSPKVGERIHTEEGTKAMDEEESKLLVKLLKRIEAQPNIVNKRGANGVTVLHGVCVNRYNRIVEMLLKHGADVNATTKYGRTPLHMAVSKGKTDTAELLLESGAEVDARDRVLGWTALYEACQNGDVGTAKLLLQHGADVNTKDDTGLTALHAAAWDGNEAIVKLLLKWDADVNAKLVGFTPEETAAIRGNEAIAEILRLHRKSMKHSAAFKMKSEKEGALSANVLKESIQEQYKSALTLFAQGVDKGEPGLSEQKRGFDMLYELAETFPENADVLFLVGNLPLGDKKTGADESRKMAMKKYTRVISLDPSHAEAYVNRGAFIFVEAAPTADDLKRLLDKGSLPSERPANKALLNEAIADLCRAIELRPRMFSAHYNRGLVLKAFGRYHEAIGSFSKAIEIGLKNPSWKGQVPTFDEERKTQVIAGAVPICLNSGFLKYIVDNCATLYSGRHRAVYQDESLIYFANADDPVAFAHYMIGSCYAAERNWQKALEHYDRAIRFNPYIGRFYQMRAISHLGTGNEGGARNDIETYKQLNNELVEVVSQR